MRYLAFVMRLLIILTGVCMMVRFPDMGSAPFISGFAIFLIGMYLGFESKMGKSFTKCIIGDSKK